MDGLTLLRRAREALPVVAVVKMMIVTAYEMVVEARGDLKADDRRVPESGDPDLTPVVIRPITVDPGIAGAGARRNVRSISRRRLIVSGALRSEAQANGEAGLGKHGTSSQEHHREQFRFHFLSCLSGLDSA